MMQMTIDKKFYKTLFSLALPIALQNFISSSLNMVDTLMIGKLGEAPIAAVAQANKIFFLYTLILFGINSGGSSFTAQFWSKKDVKGIRKVLGICLLSGGIAAIVFSIGAILFPKQLMYIFAKDPEVITLGSQYLRIVAISYLATAVTYSYSILLRSTGEAFIPMIISIISLGTNTVLNWILIFGHLGIPSMGVQGAAIATVIARLVELSLFIWLIYKKQSPLAATIKEMLDVSLQFIQRFYKTTIFVILNEFIWALGTTMYSVAYGRMGKEAVVSISISSNVEQIAMVIFYGLSSACAVMIGNEIGSENDERAFKYAKKFAVIGPVLGIFTGILVILGAPLILSIFNVSQEVYLASTRIITIFACYLPFKIFNLFMVVGILRSGGDTTFGFLIDAGGVWFIGVPFAFIAGLIWKLPIYWVFALVCSEEIFKVIFGLYRLFSKKWIHNLVNQME
ncbi:MATE family efflux transporter [Defluviitalea raffinosedens]|uniref:MATE family efflux transporter n=1 Tax=Defluviitalea raffinosedens TaxID=1450156 RepID=A0A7C8HIL9_9FIRM|nr:MATE family efflux transporter [Defluviitalea raffinosedens]KAE9635392.1 MATE family efflux transporter [Defluviitalea raffinosedens]